MQKLNSGKIGIMVSFSTPIIDSRAINNRGFIGNSGDVNTITSPEDGDYVINDLLAYTSNIMSKDLKYRDIAIYDGTQ